MVEEKILILLLTVSLILVGTRFLQFYTNATKLHLYIYSALWLILLSGILFQNTDYAISLTTYIFLCLAWLLMYAGTFFSYIFFHRDDDTPGALRLNNTGNWKLILYVLIFLSVVANYLYYKSIVAKLSSIENLVALRTDYGQEVAEESSNMFFNTFGRTYVIYIPIAVYLYKQKVLNLLSLISIIIISLVIASASLTRAPVLNVFITLFVSIYIIRLKVKIGYVALGVLSFVGLIYVITQQIALLNYIDASESNFFETASLYVFGSLKAFDNLFKGYYSVSGNYDNSLYSADFYNYFLKKLGIIDSYPSLVRDYTDVLDTNVYTYLDAFTLDFGWIGTLICPFVIGFLGGWLSCKVKNSKNIVYLVMYAYTCYGLAFSFMNNEFIRSSFFIVAAFCLILNAFANFNLRQANFK